MSSTKGSKKCNSCGKMASKPYTYTVVPSTGMYGKQKGQNPGFRDGGLREPCPYKNSQQTERMRE